MKAVVQIDIPLSKYNIDTKGSKVSSTNKELTDLSIEKVGKYCSKYGHKHIVITEPVIGYCHPVWERLDFWLNPEWFEKYDEILYLDTDVYPSGKAPDIFEENTSKYHYRRIPYHKAERKAKGVFAEIPNRYRECCANAGVMLLSKPLIDATVDTIKRYKEDRFTDDSVLINYAIMVSLIPVVDIPEGYNVKLNQCHLGDYKSGVYFFHASGNLKHTNKKEVLNYLKEDF